MNAEMAEQIGDEEDFQTAVVYKLDSIKTGQKRLRNDWERFREKEWPKTKRKVVRNSYVIAIICSVVSAVGLITAGYFLTKGYDFIMSSRDIERIKEDERASVEQDYQEALAKSLREVPVKELEEKILEGEYDGQLETMYEYEKEYRNRKTILKAIWSRRYELNRGPPSVDSAPEDS